MPAKRGKRWAAYGYDPTTRTKRYLGIAELKRDAQDMEDAWRKKHRRISRSETCDSLADRWTADYPRRRASTNRHNHERVSRFGQDFKGVQLADIDRPAARRWALSNPGRVPAVRAMFSDAMNDGLLELNPFSSLRLPGGKGRRGITAVTERELTMLGDSAVKEFGDVLGPELRALILWCGYTAMGPAETFALEWTDIRGDLVHLTRQKVDVERDVIIPPPAREALDSLPRDHRLVFTSPLGRKWTNASWYRYWYRIRARFTGSLDGSHWLPKRTSGGKPLTMYELRHAAATILLERGVTPWDVAIQLGHVDGGKLVMELYGHPSEDGARTRLLAAWGVDVGTSPAPTPIRSVQSRTSDGSVSA